MRAVVFAKLDFLYCNCVPILPLRSGSVTVIMRATNQSWKPLLSAQFSWLQIWLISLLIALYNTFVWEYYISEITSTYYENNLFCFAKKKGVIKLYELCALIYVCEGTFNSFLFYYFFNLVWFQTIKNWGTCTVFGNTKLSQIISMSSMIHLKSRHRYIFIQLHWNVWVSRQWIDVQCLKHLPSLFG